MKPGNLKGGIFWKGESDPSEDEKNENLKIWEMPYKVADLKHQMRLANIIFKEIRSNATPKTLSKVRSDNFVANLAPSRPPKKKPMQI